MQRASNGRGNDKAKGQATAGPMRGFLHYGDMWGLWSR
jgi:hypothetical protein